MSTLCDIAKRAFDPLPLCWWHFQIFMIRGWSPRSCKITEFFELFQLVFKECSIRSMIELAQILAQKNGYWWKRPMGSRSQRYLRPLPDLLLVAWSTNLVPTVDIQRCLIGALHYIFDHGILVTCTRTRTRTRMCAWTHTPMSTAANRSVFCVLYNTVHGAI